MGCGFITYDLFITGDCTSTGVGEIYIEITGGTAPYTVSETSSSGLLPTSAATTTYYFSGLTAGTYVLEIQDSCVSPAPTVTYLNIPISSGSTIQINDVTHTTCGEDNGIIEFEFNPFYGSGYYELYETTLGYISSGQTVNAINTVSPLTPGRYYFIGDDGGGCTGTSASVFVFSSNTLDYGFYVVNDASCVVGTGAGKIFITGTTGTPPYTYLWSNSATTDNITGLTAGSYGVTVTDSDGCSLSKTVDVDYVLPIGVVSINTKPPSCFTSDGEITLIVTGGTAPFYYSGSNGTVEISFSDTYTFSGLPSGLFNYLVTDAGLCTTTDTVLLVTPNSFSFGSVTTTNSNCNGSDGTIEIIVNGGQPIGVYTYTLIDASGNTEQSIVNSTNTTFSNVPSGNYTFTIDNGSGCAYTGTTTVSNTNKFTITGVTTTGTTCGLCNGAVQITVSTGGTLPYSYQIDGFPTSPVTTYNNLCAGFYTAIVTDADGCSQSQNFVITQSSGVDFIPYTQQPSLGNDGVIKVFPTDGTPPFGYIWSANVNGQVGAQVTGLTAGTYVIEVVDSTFCSKTKTVKLTGTKQVASYQIYNVCEGNFESNGTIGERSVSQLYNEGFYSLTTDDFNCVLNNAVFVAETIVDGVTKQDVFYTSTNIGDYPTTQDWIDVLRSLFSEYSQIGEVVFDIENNMMTIYNFCQQTEGCEPQVYNELTNSSVIVNLLISYDISCVECDIPPTPTMTPTLTPTMTPTMTPTPSQTPGIPIPFVMVWNTNLTGFGTTDIYNVRLPFTSTGAYSNGTINWGDGNTSPLSYANRQHTYITPGIYTITISVNTGGSLSGWNFGPGNPNSIDRKKITSITSWGQIGFIDTDNFYQCISLNLNTVIGTPNITAMTNLDFFLFGCTSLTLINNVGSWAISNITSMSEFLGGGTTLTTANYNSLLQGWASLGVSLQSGVTFDAQTTNYSIAPSAGATARNYLVTTKGWVITDAGGV
jgi:hypothetical protein